jgi:hypothetical protein
MAKRVLLVEFHLLISRYQTGFETQFGWHRDNNEDVDNITYYSLQSSII